MPSYTLDVSTAHKRAASVAPNKRSAKTPRPWRRRLALAALAMMVLAALAAIALWWSLPNVDYLAAHNPKTTAFIELRKEQALAKGHPLKLRWKWRSLKQISPYLRHAVVAAEDAKFWKHDGVDWDAMEEVAREAWETRSMRRGGSTITQQLAKNLYLSPSKSMIRKLRELFIARRLEHALTKDRILEIYLNVAEWGDGVFGAEAAAQRWFGVSAARLTPAQAARLAVALPNPFRRSAKNDAPWLDRKARRLVQSMRRAGLLKEAELKVALEALGQVQQPAP